MCPELCPETGLPAECQNPEGRATRGTEAGGGDGLNGCREPERNASRSPLGCRGIRSIPSERRVSPKGELPQGSGTPREVFHLSRRVYEKVAYRGGTEGVIAVVRARELPLEALSLPENPLILVMENVEKPGNIGAVLRSADAAGADAVLVCGSPTDLYNPNVIRASLGTVFSCQVCCCSSADAIAFLKARGIRILTAQLQDSVPYYGTDMTAGTAIIAGSEASGLSEAWREAADSHILIPMLGIADSLNVSVSAAILLYEARRQRNG
ncbi:MAG: RNA methyltransferase [Bacteroidales bacterium]|nr:RNA methyltransferase [Bacteroidales bacterium]